jgi:hypothetical protein
MLYTLDGLGLLANSEANWWLLLLEMIYSALSTSIWRPYVEFYVATRVDSEPSGVVPAPKKAATAGAPSSLIAVDDLIVYLVYL